MDTEINNLVDSTNTKETSTSKLSGVMFGILTKDRKRLQCISYYIIIQCIVVFIGTSTVLNCRWNPDDGYFEIDILARIMYLYDTEACGTTRSLKQFRDLQLPNNTHGLNIIPIKHVPGFFNVLTKLSGKTRTHLKFCLALHTLLITAAILLWSFSSVKNMKVLKIILNIFLYVAISNAIFDVCMATVYLSHIQQSLTKAMIIRYSGWGMTPRKVVHPEEFGGWVPLIAAAVWLRLIVFFGVNLYIARFIRLVMRKIRGKEVKSRMSTLCNVPFPEANCHNIDRDWSSLYFRAGEYNKM